MKRILTIGILILMAFGILFFVHYLLLQNNIKNLSLKPFTADFVQIDSEGGRKRLEKMYFSNKRMKLEMSDYSVILRFDKQLMWILVPPGEYIENSSNNVKAKLKRMTSFLKFPKKVYIGTTYIDDQMAFQFVGLKGWCIQNDFISTKDMVPLEVDLNCGIVPKFVMKFENIEIGEPNASVFEIPTGYKKLDVKNLETLIKSARKSNLNTLNL